MERITKKKLQDFINSIAIVGDSKTSKDSDNVYYSKTDGSYLTRVGMEDHLKFLLQKGITSEIHCPKGNCACVGYNPKEKKWYGWSHRAIFGFGIGSTVKNVNSGYQPVDLNDAWDQYLEFFGCFLEEMDNDPPKNPNRTRQNIHEMFEEFQTTEVNNGMKAFKPGRGGWTAKTLEDAKEMAIDFAESVS